MKMRAIQNLGLHDLQIFAYICKEILLTIDYKMIVSLYLIYLSCTATNTNWKFQFYEKLNKFLVLICKIVANKVYPFK